MKSKLFLKLIIFFFFYLDHLIIQLRERHRALFSALPCPVALSYIALTSLVLIQKYLFLPCPGQKYI
jgi:hypothetical protein